MEDDDEPLDFVRAHAALQSDEEVILDIILHSGPEVLKIASDELKADQNFMMRAVNVCSGCLLYAAPELKANKQVVQQAVAASNTLDDTCGYAFEDASQELRSDPDFVLLAVSRYCAALRYASRELLEDQYFLLAALYECKM